MKHEKKIIQLLAKKIGGAASKKELSELYKLLQQNTTYYFLFEILQSLQSEKSDAESFTQEDVTNESWQLLEGALEKPAADTDLLNTEKSRRRITIEAWLRIAALWIGIVLLVTGSYFVKRKDINEKPAKSIAGVLTEVAVRYGAPQKKLLPDSTIVWMNAGSHIRYADNFIQKNREVYLDGEAYFNVKHDAEHPFIVHIGNVIISDLGTTFNVRGYQNESKIEATLISGKIQVQIEDKPDQKIILNPKEKITVCNEELKFGDKKKEEPRKELAFQVREVSPSVTDLPEVAWLQDKLAFENEPFGELAKRMERRYDVNIVFKDSLLEKERLSGVFKNENIRKALHLLQLTTPFSYQFQQDTVYLKQ